MSPHLPLQEEAATNIPIIPTIYNSSPTCARNCPPLTIGTSPPSVRLLYYRGSHGNGDGIKIEGLKQILTWNIVRSLLADMSWQQTLVSGSTSRTLTLVSRAETSGTKLSLRSRSSSCNLKEIPRTGPFWIRFIKWVVKPAILLRRRFEGTTAWSSSLSEHE